MKNINTPLTNYGTYDWDELGDIIVSIIDRKDSQHELTSGDIVNGILSVIHGKGDITLQ